MRQTGRAIAGLRLASWAMAGALLLGVGATATAQDAIPESIEVVSETTDAPVALPAAATGRVGGGTAPSVAPAAGVGLGAGTAPLSIGALVGAGVAAIFALRERMKGRG